MEYAVGRIKLAKQEGQMLKLGRRTPGGWWGSGRENQSARFCWAILRGQVEGPPERRRWVTEEREDKPDDRFEGRREEVRDLVSLVRDERPPPPVLVFR